MTERSTSTTSNGSNARILLTTLTLLLIVALGVVFLRNGPAIVGAAPIDPNTSPLAQVGGLPGSTSGPRIAALLPFAADQLIEMGVKPVAVARLVGETPPAWQGIPTIAIDHSAGPNLEQLIAVDPDIVITSAVYAQFLATIEQSTGATIEVMDVNSVSEVEQNIQRLGALTGLTSEAATVLSDVQAQLETNSPDGAPVRVLAVFGTPHSFYAFLPSSYLGDLVAHAGGEMITDDMKSHGVFRGLAPLSMEAVIARDPDHILVVFHGPEAAAQAMLDADPLWSRLSAIEKREVSFLTDDLYAMRPGSELPRAAREIAAILDGVRERRR